MPETTVGLTVLPGEQIVVLILQIVLEAMRGQTLEQRQQLWQWWIEDYAAWRKFWKLGG